MEGAGRNKVRFQRHTWPGLDIGDCAFYMASVCSELVSSPDPVPRLVQRPGGCGIGGDGGGG